ncbi:OsmC family protein [Cellulomonas endophytica]|uniref:OsmC family protein n=1 Tax=Cellulomonas endophytica TaxID=2494735 RepID=UPI001F0C8E92|nr:OsmC family protein [Cellulomonas endophytica]
MALDDAVPDGRLHLYRPLLRWTGARGTGTSGYRAYGRDHEVHGGDRPVVLGSSDPAFRGDADRWSPEDLLVASLAQCHMLWFLHLAAEAGVVVTAYTDAPEGRMVEEPSGAGRFVGVELRPAVTVREPAPAAPVAGRRTAAGEDHDHAGDVPGDDAADGPDDGLRARLGELHARAHERCFIARSVAFPVTHRPAEPVRSTG